MESVKRVSVPDCIVCGAKGTMLYRGLQDARFGIPGSFDMAKCGSCGLLWLDPWVAPEDIHVYYETFFPRRPLNQSEERPAVSLLGRLKDATKKIVLCGYYGYRSAHPKHYFCFLGRILGYFRYFRMKATWDIEDLFLPFQKDMAGRLLIDVGCGEGTYLEMMHKLGWPVFGIEPHEDGCRSLARKGIPFLKGTLDDAKSLPDSIADQISLVHVLEHVYDPLAAINECYRLLKKGGRLVIHVPNAESLSHQVFKQNCYHLDPPRHVFSFSAKSLRILFEKSLFKTASPATVSFNAKSIYDSCKVIAEKGFRHIDGVKRQKGRLLFYLRETLMIMGGRPVGEEIRVVAVK